MTCDQIRRLPDLSPLEKWLLQAITAFAKRKGCFASDSKLAAEVCTNESQVRKMLLRLEKRGYIRREGRGVKRKIFVLNCSESEQSNCSESEQTLCEKRTNFVQKVSKDTSIIGNKSYNQELESAREAAAAAASKKKDQFFSPKDPELDAGKEPVNVATQIKQALGRKLELAHSEVKAAWLKNYGVNEQQALKQIPQFLDWFIANHREWAELDESEILLRARKMPAIQIQTRFGTSWLANHKRKQTAGRRPVNGGQNWKQDNNRNLADEWSYYLNQ